MRKIERSIFTGNLEAIEGIAKVAKTYYVDVEWLYSNKNVGIAMIAISGRVTEMLYLKETLPKLRKEGNVYSV